MSLRFNTLSPDKKKEMGDLIKRWDAKKLGVPMLEEALGIIAKPGRMDRLKLMLLHSTPRNYDIIDIAFTTGLGYQGKGALEMDDAERLLEMIREVKALVPSPPDVTRSAILLAASVLLESTTPDPKPSYWPRIAPLLKQSNPDAFQPSLF